MMNYTKPYKMTIPDFYAHKYYMTYKWQERTTDPYIFMSGVRLPCPDMKNGALKTSTDPKDYDLIFHANAKPEEFLKYGVLQNTAASTFLLRRDLVDVLNEFCPDDFQAFPVTIVPEKPKKLGEFENRDYSLLNITHNLDLLDHDKCEFKYSRSDPSIIIQINKMVVQDASCLKGHHIVRDKTLLSHIFVSPAFVALFTELKVKGCHFRKDAEG